MHVICPETRYHFIDIYGKKFSATDVEVHLGTPHPSPHFSRNPEDYRRLILKNYEHADGTRNGGTVNMPYDWIVKADVVLSSSEIFLDVDQC
jgi:hypothetical protein